MKLYETEEQARQAAGGLFTVCPTIDDEKIMYYVITWDGYRQNLEDNASALYDGGWRGSDTEELAACYGFPVWYASDLCNKIATLEEEQADF